MSGVGCRNIGYSMLIAPTDGFMMDEKRKPLLKISECSKLLGTTIRTLRYYDSIGLARPSQHTNSGHRLYCEADVVHLQNIQSLQYLGFTLEQIRCLLGGSIHSIRDAIDQQLESDRTQIASLNERACILENIRNSFDPQETLPEVAQRIDKLRIFKQYFSESQQQFLAEKSNQWGPIRLEQWRSEGFQLLSAIRREFVSQTAPESPAIGKLLKLQQQHFKELVGDDAELAAAFRQIYENEPRFRQSRGIDDDLYVYLKHAESYHGI